jgi:hypothetical protein
VITSITAIKAGQAIVLNYNQYTDSFFDEDANGASSRESLPECYVPISPIENVIEEYQNRCKVFIADQSK